MNKERIKIALFDLTDCEGCELQFLTLKEKMLDFFQDYEILNWRLLEENRKIRYYDLVFITGTPVKKEEQEFLKLIRSRTKFLVALGNCAVSAAIPGLVKEKERKRLTEYVYKRGYKAKAIEARPLKDYVKVDKEIPGCPVEFLALENFIKEIPRLTRPSPPLFRGPCRFVPDYVTKIEGHGSLKVNFRDSQARLEIEEGERLIEGILLGRDFSQAPWIVSRICGICPVAHNLASLKALEDALKIRPNEIITSLRKLLLYGQIIHSHLFHLFFLSLPDYLAQKSGLDLAKVCPAEFHLALNIKRSSEKILIKIGGQAIHPTNTKIGGFIKLPERKELFSLLNELSESIDEAEDLVKFFLKLKYPNFKRKTEYLGLGEGYEFYEGKVISNKNEAFPPKDYKKEIKEEIRPYSTAKFGKRKDGFMLGALARISLHEDLLNKRAKALLEASGLHFPTYNPFHNNLAQALEILHLYEESLKELEKLTSLKEKDYKNAEKNIDFIVKAASGVGALEAPRGTLYHFYEIDKEGKIKNADIIPPTVCNLSNLEGDAKGLLKKRKGLPKEKKVKLLEMLIRAYDPCITCAVH